MRIESLKYMLMVQDMDRAVAFYRDVVGLKVNSQSPMWSELAHGDAVVAPSTAEATAISTRPD
jgi:catechol 2,3-dioxygenase-like lactoylglutathione lyase family enzyme|tara:strand:+ start:8132 stop:8320 length:189 start_codon:yes stop_codon:yes gene_type:complete